MIGIKITKTYKNYIKSVTNIFIYVIIIKVKRINKMQELEKFGKDGE